MSCRCLIYILYWCWSESSGIFPSTFMQLVNGSKNSILNWDMKLDLFMLFLKKPSRIYYSIHLFFLLFLWFRWLQKRKKESCMYLSSQLFLETLYKTLKFQEKSERVRERESKKPERVLEIIFKGSGDLNFKDFLFDAYCGGTYRR